MKQWEWYGDLCRHAYLLTLPTSLGWHEFASNGGPADLWCCVKCHQPYWDRTALCPNFLPAIPSVTADPHDAIVETPMQGVLL